jgi:hypothetical protein
MMPTIDWEISVGDILTSVTVFISALTLASQFSKDRDTQRLEQANEVRAAAAKTLESLQRWSEISLSLFDELQPEIVKTTVQLADSHDRLPARDSLYRDIRAIYLRKIGEVQKERISVSYISMYKFNPSIKPYFESMMTKLRGLNTEMIDAVLDGTQDDILHADANETQTAVLGNQLRKTTDAIRTAFDKRIQTLLSEPETFLSGLILLSDAELLVSSNLDAPKA